MVGLIRHVRQLSTLAEKKSPRQKEKENRSNWFADKSYQCPKVDVRHQIGLAVEMT